MICIHLRNSDFQKVLLYCKLENSLTKWALANNMDHTNENLEGKSWDTL